MIALRLSTRALLVVMAASAVQAQSATDPAIPPTIAHRHKALGAKPARAALNPNLVVLDPGHGGADPGATLGDKLLEKDVTLALAGRLRDLLTARGFTVQLTHESAADDLTTDQRAELTNRSHPVACLLLHAVSGGHGVHLFTSSLSPINTTEDSATTSAIVPWDTAQTPMLAQSARLAGELVTALKGARIQVALSNTSIRPIDSITSPAIALELAPLANATVPDAAYQQHVAEAIVSALVLWREQTITQAKASAAATKPSVAYSAPAKPKLKTPLGTPAPPHSPGKGPQP